MTADVGTGRWVVAGVSCLVTGAAASVLAGQDGNWDLLNYHLYNGAAFLLGRSGSDLFVAGMQSTLNPVLDAIYAGLALGPWREAPRWVAAAMGLWYGLLLFAAFGVAGRLYAGRVQRFVGVALGTTGVATLLQIGTTTGELPAGALMLAGLAGLLRGRAGMAGALFGLTAGLKLTALAYAPAGLLAALVMGHGWWRFGLLWMAGFLVADGWWAWSLWQRFESPVFPLFNGVFQSSWYPPASLLDDRFFPSKWGWLVYPFTWSGDVLPRPGELAFQDFRLAAALGLGVVALVWRPRLTRAQGAALAFLLAGYVTWLTTSSILRYAVVLEAMAGLAIPLLLPGRVPLLAGAAALLLSTRPMASARVPYQPLSAEMGWVAPDTLIVVTFRGASSHAIAMMEGRPPGVEVIGAGTPVLDALGWRLHDEAVRRVRAHVGPIAVVTEADMEGNFAELGEIGLDPHLSECRPIGSTFIPVGRTGIHHCQTARIDPPRRPSPFWAAAAGRYRTVYHPLDRAMSLVGAAYLRDAGPAARGTRFIDWADLLWSGVRQAGAPVPLRLDPGTLYILAPELAGAMQALVDPARDAFGWVDDLLVIAPGGSPWVRPARVGPAALGPGDIAAAVPWTGWSGPEVSFVLPVAAAGVVHLSGRAFTAPGLATQRVVVQVGDGPAVTQVLRGEGEITAPVPAGVVRVRLTFPDAASPESLGVSREPRRLGFAVRAVWMGA